jgi:hypothetical protein
MLISKKKKKQKANQLSASSNSVQIKRETQEEGGSRPGSLDSKMSHANPAPYVGWLV